MNRGFVVARLGLPLLLLIVFVVAGYMTQDFHQRGAWFPLLVSAVGALLALVTLLKDTTELVRTGTIASYRTVESGPRDSDDDDASSRNLRRDFATRLDAAGSAEDGEDRRFSAWTIWLAIIVYVVGIRLIGFVPSTLVWLVAFLMTFGRLVWWKALGITIMVLALTLLLAEVADIRLPTGRIISGRWFY